MILLKNIYSSVDIGTDTIKVVVCELYQNKLNLLAATSVKSRGIKKGLIYDVSEARSSLRKAIHEIEEMLGIHIRQVICSVPSYYANFNLVTTIPIDFKIDSKVVVKSPLGMPALKLDARAIAVSVPKKNIYSVLNLMESIGLTVKDISINGIGDMYAFKNKDIDSKVGAIINIGYESTSVSLYNKVVIVKNSMID